MSGQWEYCALGLAEGISSYRIMGYDNPSVIVDDADDAFTQLGIQGWELTAAYRRNKTDVFIFKRPLVGGD